MVEEKIITIRDVEYIVSSDGKVYSTGNSGQSYYHKEISQRLNADGYLQITVGKTGDRTQYRVHRLVAEAFIPNPDNLPEVNHKDYDRTNNTVSNLEWSTHADNVIYSSNAGHYSHFGEDNPNYGNHKLAGKNNPRCRAVYCFELDEYFWGAKEASLKYGFSRTGITACCSHKRQSCGKHPLTNIKLHWIYVDEMNNSSVA
jgi:hypothetical protein